MSELKTRFVDDTYVEYFNTGKHDLAQIYLKSEADKVIAEKDAKILALDAEVFKQKHHAKLFLDERNYAETQLHRHKYKRCLAMAKWCEMGISYWDDDEQEGGWEYKKLRHCIRWKKRWLELAEKFKEAK